MVIPIKAKTAEDRALHFLATLLDETIYNTCTDSQHELAYEFASILGDYCPDWINPWKEDNEDG